MTSIIGTSKRDAVCEKCFKPTSESVNKYIFIQKKKKIKQAKNPYMGSTLSGAKALAWVLSKVLLWN